MYSRVSSGCIHAFKSLVKNQGLTRLWRGPPCLPFPNFYSGVLICAQLFAGVGTMFTACVPAHAAYFSLYETSKEAFGANQVRDRRETGG